MSTVSIVSRVQALYSFKSNDPSSLSFKRGDCIEVLTKLPSGWWDGWCNGERGWFPSNYVQEIEEYDEDDTQTIRGNESDTVVTEAHPHARIGSAEDQQTVVTPRLRHGVPLQRNNEYRLSLPYQPSGFEIPDIHLPGAWSLQLTEDGTGRYFYNQMTGEMRSDLPENADLVDDHYQYPIHHRHNGSIDSTQSDDDAFDFRSVDSRLLDERSLSDKLEEDVVFPDKVPPPWEKRTTPDGRVFYCNLETQETTWDATEIDSETGQLMATPLQDDGWRLNIEELSGQFGPAKPPPPRPLPRSPSRQPSVRRTTVIDSHEPLTWNKLLAHIALSIHNLNTAAKNMQRTMLVRYASAIVDAIRMMLVTSGTIDKESVHIKANAVLRAHHRALMASMSKLVLSSQLNAEGAPDSLNRLLSEANELLLAVRNYVSTCQDIHVPVQHTDIRILDNDEMTSKTKSRNDLATVVDGHRAKYALQNDLADNLETYGISMHESVEGMLSCMKAEEAQTDDRLTLASRLFAQFRNLSNQTGQFIGIIEDVDYGSVSNSPLMTELQESKQQLSCSLGLLFYHLQLLTDETTSRKEILVKLIETASVVSEPIGNICACVNDLVEERKSVSRASDVSMDTIYEGGGNKSRRLPKESIIREEGEVDMDAFSRENEMGYSDMEMTSLYGSTLNEVPWEPGTPLTPEDIKRHRSEPSRASGDAFSGLAMQRSPTTPETPSKTSAKLKKFFGDDAPAAVAAAAKPIVNERPWFLQYDYDANEIMFNMEGYVKGGTLRALVERLTLHDYLDMNFINTFLLTYRSFCTSLELLELLEARFNLTPPEGMTEEEKEIWLQRKLKLVRLRVFNVLKNWLELYYNEEDHVILDRLLHFTNTSIRSSLSFSSDQLERLVRKRQEASTEGGLKKMVLTLPDPPDPILPRNRKKFRLLDIDTLEMARQLTIMDFKMYSAIRPVECLDKAWSRDSNDEKGSVAVHIRASIEYCNQVTAWVSDAVLSQTEIKKRCTLIKYWVQVAEKCRILNNFNTCMAILSAFDNSSVGRLKRTWEMVGARTNQTLNQIRKLMGAERNFTEYRAIIHSINPPCIPFLGIYLQDLTFIEDGNGNYLKSSKELINFAKRAKTAEVIREIQQYQSSLYQLKPVEEIQSFILSNLQSTRDEDQLYEESLKLEPREREDEKITRLLQESGFL
ncbi:hypothetical protein EC973_006336 [Apophysomyces ossiformis]|uniref:Uncharacterized protein n=1 Tax=Apophysomyces ossiformis TaxID=679940 RepID=A0A8H7BT93_9FUNG|nr:hypothetical protein EC973_006336 [Apophysomyces ossiformis]